MRSCSTLQKKDFLINKSISILRTSNYFLKKILSSCHKKSIKKIRYNTVGSLRVFVVLGQKATFFEVRSEKTIVRILEVNCDGLNNIIGFNVCWDYWKKRATATIYISMFDWCKRPHRWNVKRSHWEGRHQGFCVCSIALEWKMIHISEDTPILYRALRADAQPGKLIKNLFLSFFFFPSSFHSFRFVCVQSRQKWSMMLLNLMVNFYSSTYDPISPAALQRQVLFEEEEFIYFSTFDRFSIDFFFLCPHNHPQSPRIWFVPHVAEQKTLPIFTRIRNRFNNF